MEHFDDGAEADAGFGMASGSFRSKQEKQRADALSAASDEVLGNVGDDFDAGSGLGSELTLDGGEVVAEKVENLT